MATFKEFCERVKKGFGKLGHKVGRAADTASLRIKLAGIDGKLSDHYAELGKLTYIGIRGTATEEEQARVEALLTIIDGKVTERKAAEEELAEIKTEKKVEVEVEAEAEAPATEEAEQPAEEAEAPAAEETPKAE